MVTQYSMRVKRFILFLFIGCIGIATFQPIANSAVKAGSACSKLRMVKIDSNYKYTCIKLGTKLVWSKGLKINAVENSPSPSPSNNKPFNLDNLDPEQVYIKSRAEIAKYISLGNLDGAQIKYLIGPNVLPSEVEIAKNQIFLSIKLWSSVFKPTKATIVWYSLKDKDWAKNIWVSEGGTDGPWSGFNSCNERWCRNGTAGMVGDKLLMEFGLEWAGDQSSEDSRPTSAHEYAHFAQMAMAGSSTDPIIWWAVEGGAQFYGESVGWATIEDSKKSIRLRRHSQSVRDSQEHISMLYPGETLTSLFMKQDPDITKKLMKSIEKRTGGQSTVVLNYLMGAYATEVLVAVFGQEKMANFYKLHATNKNSEVNFQNVFGISLDEFYAKLTPYLFKMAENDLSYRVNSRA